MFIATIEQRPRQSSDDRGRGAAIAASSGSNKRQQAATNGDDLMTTDRKAQEVVFMPILWSVSWNKRPQKLSDTDHTSETSLKWTSFGNVLDRGLVVIDAGGVSILMISSVLLLPRAFW